MASDTDHERGKKHEKPKNKKKSNAAKYSHDDQSKSLEQPGEPGVAKVKVLLLTFKHSDLSELEKETQDVKTAFEQLNYSVTTEYIPMKKSLKKLKRVFKRFLPEKQGSKSEDAEDPGSEDTQDLESNDTLYIIYYHGHGGLNTDNGQFTILSHNYPSSHELCSTVLPKVFDELGKVFDSAPGSQRSKWEEARKKFGDLQPVAEIAWEDISDIIMDAPCNTLVVLDCCNAGLASAMSLGENKPKLKFRKELLGACSWGTSTQDRMSPALCEVLRKIPESGAVSVGTVVRDMNESLVTEFVTNKKANKKHQVPQAVHYVLGRTKRDRIILHRLDTPAS